jgi:hypothetical protein
MEVDSLLLELAASPGRPGWYTHPETEAEFAASVLVHCREMGWANVEPIYDADVLIGYRGLRPRRGVA